MREAFISYSRLNADWVDSLVSALDVANVPVWIDRRGLPMGMEWWREIEVAIAGADLFVDCVSPDSLKSLQCERERTHANNLQKVNVRVDVTTESPEAAAKRVQQAYLGLTHDDRFTTALVRRAISWKRDGEAKGWLIRGQRLNQALNLVYRRVLPTVAHEFILASRAGDRRRRWRLGIAAILVVAMFIAVLSQLARRDDVSEASREAAVAVGLYQVTVGQARGDAYALLRDAIVLSFSAGHGDQARKALIAALEIPVPTRSFVVPDVVLTGFTAAPTDGAVSVVDSAGREFRDGVATGRRVSLPEGSDECCRLTAGSLHIAAMADGSVMITDSTSGVTQTLAPAGSGGRAVSMAISPDGTALAVTSEREGTIRIYSIGDRELMASVARPGVGGPISFSPNGRYLAAGSGPDVHIIDVRNRTTLHTLRGSVGVVRSLAWSPGGESVWAIAGDNRVSGWRWRPGTVLLDDPARRFVALAGPTRDGLMVAVTRDGDILTITQGEVDRNVLAPSGVDMVFDADLDPTGRYVALATGAGPVVVDRLGQSVQQLGNRTCTPLSVSFAHDSAALYVACTSGHVLRLDIATGEVVASARPGTSAPNDAVSVRAYPGGGVFIGRADGVVEHWDASLSESAAVHHGCGAPVRTVASSSDGNIVLFAGDAVCARLVYRDRGDDGRFVVARPIDDAKQSRAVAMNATALVGAVGLSTGAVNFVLIPLNEGVGTSRAVGGEVRGLAFDPDRNEVVVATLDGMLLSLPQCPLCLSTEELVTLAAKRVKAAADMGLTTL